MTTRTLAAAAVLTTLALTGCGSDEPTPQARAAAAETTLRASTTGHPIEVHDGVGTQELLDCLTGAGLDATLADTTPYLVEVPSDTIEVTGMTGYDGEPSQSASLHVFADPATAADNAALVSLDYDPQELGGRTAVHQNVVRSFAIVTDTPDTADEAALLSCMPGYEPVAEVAVTSGWSPDYLVELLAEAGLQATVTSAPPPGVEPPVVLVRTEGLTAADGSPTGASSYVFSDDDRAAQLLPQVWTGDQASPRVRLDENVVTVFDVDPDPADPATGALVGVLED